MPQNQTRLIIYERPDSAIKKPLTTIATGTVGAQTIGATGSFFYQYKNNLNNVITNGQKNSLTRFGRELDLYNDIQIPLNFTINDIKEPDKIKTTWSKSIKLPGTKTNNKIFSQYYDLGTDMWITIGSTSVWQNFNPHIRTEIVLLSGDIEILKGNLQLKSITKDRFGNIEYEIALSGQLTSLFSDIDNTKLKDLDWSLYDHIWSRDNITNSWDYINSINGTNSQIATRSTRGTYIKGILKWSDGRLAFKTHTAHNLAPGDYVKINLDSNIENKYKSATGEWLVMSVNSTEFSVNQPYPMALSPFGEATNINIGTCEKINLLGLGYVYPMIQWGDEIDHNSWPVTAFAPGYYIRGIIDKIFETTNSTYDSNFFNSEYFKRLIYIQKKSSYELNPVDVKVRKFAVGLTASYHTALSQVTPNRFYWPNLTNPTTTATASTRPTEFQNRVPFRKETGGFSTQSFYDNGATVSNAIGNWDENSYKWVVRNNGEYALNATLNLSCQCQMNGYVNSLTSSGTASFQPTNPNFIYYPGNIRGFTNFGGPITLQPDPSSQWSPSNCGVRVVAKIWLRRNGIDTQIGETTTDQFYMNRISYWAPDNTNWLNFGVYQPVNWRNFQVQIQCNNFYFAKDDEVWVDLQMYNQARQTSGPSGGVQSTMSFSEIQNDLIIRAIRGDWWVSLNSQSFIFNDPTPKATEGSIILGQSFFNSELTCRDFLLSICKMFNLYVESDSDIERRYRIEPRDSYYRGGTQSSDFIDWSDKLDETSVQILPMSEFVSKTYIFKYKDESDYWNSKFKTERGRLFGEYKKTISNDFKTDVSGIEIAQFASTVMINYPQFSDVVMPSIIQRDGGTNKPVSNPAGRILIWGGLKPYTAFRGGSEINLENPQTNYLTGFEIISSEIKGLQSATFGTPLHQYPYCGLVDSPQDPYHDINWFNMDADDFVYYDFARWSNANLFNRFYSNMVRELADPGSRVLVANFALKPSDIKDLDFSKIYNIGGHWMRLQKVIDFDAANAGLTKCEFLKLNAPFRWQRQSIVVNQFGEIGSQFTDYEIVNQKPATEIVPDKQYSPIKKRPDVGFQNINPATDLSSNQNQTTNGQSNFISTSAKNIQINGNENAIGSGAMNINITSGDGNFVTGGVKNVNLIGTSKRYVSESDVTYINGIRYKLGSPISKSQVIDAGQDIALQKTSDNTIITVLDACEDVVILGGSSGFENTIDAGVDRILPDVGQLGLGTLTNPNPRTNSFGGFIVQNPTFSTIELIRKTNYLKS